MPSTVTLPTGSTDSDGLTLSLAYTAAHRPRQLGYSNAAVDFSFGRGYDYDSLERIEAVVRGDADDTETRTLEYDALGQLRGYHDVRDWVENTGETVCDDPMDLSTCHPVTEQHSDTLRQATYTYDRVGNRTDTGAVVETGNRLTQFDGYALEYDADGNLKRKSKAGFEQTFAWNALGQLTRVTTNGSTNTFGYDGFGRRVRKTVDGATTRSLHDGDDLVLELDGAGNPIREYAYYPGVDNPHSIRRSSDGAVFYYATELPGHVAGLVNSSGQVANRYTYTPFGEPITASEQVPQPLRFTAWEWDAERGTGPGP